MHRITDYFSALAILAFVSCAATETTQPEPTPAISGDEPRSPLRLSTDTPRPQARIADYSIAARLDTATQQIQGRAQLTFHNRSQQSVDVLQLHTYMNAFRSNETDWLRSAGETNSSHRGHKKPADKWGYIDISDVSLVSVQPTKERLEAPPRFSTLVATTSSDSSLKWTEHREPTTGSVELTQPIDPGTSVTIEVGFTTQLPPVFARTGYHDDFYLAGQWFPKLAVLSQAGTWDNHTFSYNSEFYADFGSYVVSLDVPNDMIVGASGVRTSVNHQDSGRAQHVFRASMVHDFAWTASPSLSEHSVRHNGVDIRLLYPIDSPILPSEYLDTQRHALDFYEKQYGPYPWSTLTIVIPPEGAGGAAGMEYPTFFTSISSKPAPFGVGPILDTLLDERMSAQYTTLHEFGHQYFQGILASHEHSEPWMDEGLNTFTNALAHADRFGDDDWLLRLFGLPMTNPEMIRLSLAGKRQLHPIDSSAADFHPLEGGYGATVYYRTAAVFLTLRNLAGAQAFDKAFHDFTLAARFRHPTGAQLIQHLVTELGASIELSVAPPDSSTAQFELEQFLQAAMSEVWQTNYWVHKLENTNATDSQGWVRDENGDLVLKEASDDSEPTKNGKLVIAREGNLIAPVEVEVTFVDGTMNRRLWDGRENYKTFHFPGKTVVRAEIDPQRKLIVERWSYDNVMTTTESDSLATNSEVEDSIARFSELASLAVLLGGTL